MVEEKEIIPEQESPGSTEEQAPKGKKRKPWWVRLLIWTGATVLTVALLIVLLISLVVWILTPEKLTPLVNRYASEYLVADVDARRVELTFWHTFPRFSVDVDSLQITSRSLRQLPDSVKQTLSSDADSLLFVKRFSGGINIAALTKGDISIYDVDIEGTRANLVQVDSLTANYLIMPPSEPETAEEKPLEIPNISLNSFKIADGLTVRFRIPADTLDCTLAIQRAHLADSAHADRPLYTLSTSGDAEAKLAMFSLPRIPFGIDGTIEWESKKPMQVGLEDFSLRIGEVEALFATKIDMTDTLTVHEFKATVPKVELMKIVEVLPPDYKGMFKELDTDLKVAMDVKLLRAYHPTVANELPMVDASFQADARKIIFGRLNLKKLTVDVNTTVDLNNIDAAKINLVKLSAAGKAMDFTLDGTVSHPLTDPDINANFNGTLTIQNLPQQLLGRLPCAVRGVLHGEAQVKTRLSYLTPKNFHRAKIDGEITLSDFRMAMTDGSLDAFMNHGSFKLGSRSSITVKDHLVDSMLTASLTIDTLSLLTPEMMLSGSSFDARVGARNTASSADTSQINPIGATIRAGRIIMRSDSDSIRVRLRNSQISASLQRYEGKGRSPLLKTLVKTGVAVYADRYNRAILREGEATFLMYPKGRPQMSAARQARFDSIAMLHPELTADSVMGLMRRQTREAMASYDKSREGREDIAVELDKPMRNMFMRWNASGMLRAARVRLFTPYFPSRNTLTNLDLSFSTDSVVLRDTRLEMDNSDFVFSGAIHNLRQALLSRHGAPYKLDFNVSSDTIDVNHLMATMIRGAVFADRIAAGTMKTLADTESEEALQRQFDSEIPDTARAAVLIPSNITARFAMQANHVLYSDLWLHGLDGLVEIYDGALNLDKLRAYTNIGAVNFSALYQAPTVDDLSLAAAVRVRRLNLRSVLDMMPQVDSILPLLGEVRGIVDTDLALTTELDSNMDLKLNTLNMVLKISGDSLQLLDNETFRTIAKWMLFKKKDRNLIDHMDVELAVHDGYIDLYPFIFDMDRYRLGVRGSNDAAFNLDYHVAVIKSPIPFKFGINIKGTPENMKIRLGKARINEKTVAESRHISDTVRVNLTNEINKAFRRGIRSAGSKGLKLESVRKVGGSVGGRQDTSVDDTFSHADSVLLIQQGLIDRPAGFIMPGDTIPAPIIDKKSKSLSHNK